MSYAIPYFVALDDCSSLTLGEFSELILRAPKKRVGAITLEELCSVSEYPHGLYLIFDGNNSPCYVGKATSRSFIERIPSHFDPREIAWFNTIPKRVMKFSEGVVYQDALKQGLSLNILLIGINDTRATGKLERVLRSYMRPRFNSRKFEFSANDSLAELVSS